MKRVYKILGIILFVAIGLVVIFIGYYPTASILADYSSLRCARNGDLISCTLNWNYPSDLMCGSGDCESEWNFCTRGAIEGLPGDIGSVLGESYTAEQKQDIYDNLKLSGDCSLGYPLDYGWGTCGLWVKGRSSYLQLSQEYPVNMGDINVDGTWQQIFAFLGTFNNQGTCTFSTSVSAATSEQPTGTLNLAFVGIVGGLSLFAVAGAILFMM